MAMFHKYFCLVWLRLELLALSSSFLTRKSCSRQDLLVIKISFSRLKKDPPAEGRILDSMHTQGSCTRRNP